ncbi:MAG TPA: Gfo/Idh/MocA family oxidoreductase [Rhizomicrobium sp.]|nr:Gfo/Idh/MocA family oxidoreductase [Rhizomicrobium sp.]
MVIRVGILGASRIAPAAVIAPAKDNSDFLVIAVAARERHRAEAYAREHGIPGVMADYATLVTHPGVDLVYNPLPPALHVPWTLAALNAGKAVLLEKPFAMNAAEAREMVAASERTGRPLIEAFHYRYHNVMRRAVEIARSGELGRPTEAEAMFQFPIAFDPGELRWIAPVGGGALMDMGCYPLHALRSVIGGEPEIVSAECDIQHGVDAAAKAQMIFPGGIRAKMSCSMMPESFGAFLRLAGERGTLEIVNFLAPQYGYSFKVTVDGKTREEKPDGPSTYAAQLAAVADVLMNGATPLTGGADAIGNMAAIDAIYAKAGYVRGT